MYVFKMKIKQCSDCGKLIKDNSYRCRMCNGKNKAKDITGSKFNLLTVIKRISSDRKKGVLWECICDCGNICRVSGNHLTRNSHPVKSCGCIIKLHGPRSKNWKGFGEISGQFWLQIVRSANGDKGSRKPVGLSVTIYDCWNLFLKQNRKCALSGMDIYFPININQRGTASLDRIDSSLGYVHGNIQWVHKDVNRMKNVFTQSHFIDMCTAIAKNNILSVVKGVV